VLTGAQLRRQRDHRDVSLAELRQRRRPGQHEIALGNDRQRGRKVRYAQGDAPRAIVPRKRGLHRTWPFAGRRHHHVRKLHVRVERQCPRLAPRLAERWMIAPQSDT
jgi:hypothetical protein